MAGKIIQPKADISRFAVSPVGIQTGEDSPPPKFKEWAKENAVITYRSGGIGLWKDWSFGQCAVDDVVEQCLADNVPAMIVLPKIRQFVGMSLYCEGRIFHNGHYRPQQTSAVFAHQTPSTHEIFRSVYRLYNYLQESEKANKPLKGDKVHKTHMQYEEPWGSKIVVATAGTVHAMRGWKLDCAHVSEHAFIEDAETFFTALAPCMPIESNPRILWFLESTCWNRGHFDKMITQGLLKKKGDWITMFLSWLKEPKCRRVIQVPGEYEPDDRERKYMQDHKIELDQMYFHSTFRKTVCGGSWERMYTEMPTTLAEARMFTGRPWFDQERIESLLISIDQNALDIRFFDEESIIDWPAWCHREPEKALLPEFRGEIDWASKHFPSIKLVIDEFGSLLIWKYPIPGRRYIIGADAAHGLGPKADYTDVTVMDAETGLVVAHYRNNFIKPEDAGDVVARLGVYYNWARLWVEWNGPGSTMLLSLVQQNRNDTPLKQGYPNIAKDENTRTEQANPSDRIGFTSHVTSKNNLMDFLTKDFSAGRITTYSEQMLLQMRGLGAEPNKGKVKEWKWIPNHEDEFSGLCNDDSIMSLGLANVGRRENRGEDQWIQAEAENF